MTPVELTRLWDEVDETVMLERRDRAPRLDQIIERICARADVATDPEALYVIAYCRYAHPARLDSLQGRREFEDSVQRVLDTEPDHLYAKLYLAYHYFDVREWLRAKQLFESIDVPALADDDRAKVRELLVCVELHGLGLEAALEMLETFVQSRLGENELEVPPVHLLETLVEVASNSDRHDAVRRAFRLAQKLVAHAHQEGLFGRELKALESLSMAGHPAGERKS